jgi:hypothetical protein
MKPEPHKHWLHPSDLGMKGYIYSTLYITLYCAQSRERSVAAQDLIGNGNHNGFIPLFQLLCFFGANNMGAESMMPNGSCTREKNPYKICPNATPETQRS